jgi:hypothetical protein
MPPGRAQRCMRGQTWDVQTYIEKNFCNLSLDIPMKYHKTHTSSRKNEWFGPLADCTYWNMEFDEIVQLLTKISDAIHPTQQNQLLMIQPVSKTNNILLSNLSIISPALYVLRTQLDGLEFDSRSEDVHSMIYNTGEVPKRIEKSLLPPEWITVCMPGKMGKRNGRSLL